LPKKYLYPTDYKMYSKLFNYLIFSHFDEISSLITWIRTKIKIKELKKSQKDLNHRLRI